MKRFYIDAVDMLQAEVVRTLGALPQLVEHLPSHVVRWGTDAVELPSSLHSAHLRAEHSNMMQAELVLRTLGALPHLVEHLPSHIVRWGADAVKLA